MAHPVKLNEVLALALLEGVDVAAAESDALLLCVPLETAVTLTLPESSELLLPLAVELAQLLPRDDTDADAVLVALAAALALTSCVTLLVLLATALSLTNGVTEVDSVPHAVALAVEHMLTLRVCASETDPSMLLLTVAVTLAEVRGEDDSAAEAALDVLPPTMLWLELTEALAKVLNEMQGLGVAQAHMLGLGDALPRLLPVAPELAETDREALAVLSTLSEDEISAVALAVTEMLAEPVALAVSSAKLAVNSTLREGVDELL